VRRNSLVFAAVTTVIAAASCTLVLGESTEDRMARQLGLPDVGSTDAMRAGLLQKVPIGSSSSDVVAFLKARGVGQDPLSGYEIADGGARIYAHIDRDRSNTWRLVQFDYGINFKLDEHRTLTDVVVAGIGTGP
jgi:hypothetical protein